MMPTMILHRGDDGRLCGVSEREQAAYERFRSRIATLDGSITLTYRVPRSGPCHRRYFAIVGALFEAQEQFDDAEVFRKWLEVGAGYCRLVPGPKGKPCAVPDSIAYERLEQDAFEKVVQRVEAFARSLHATRFLWPDIDDITASSMVETILMEFA